ncbi:hypothetical protein [Blastococcus sp. SYSU DS1024]
MTTHQQRLGLFLGRCRAVLHDGADEIHVHSWLWSREIRSVWRNPVGDRRAVREVPREEWPPVTW